MLIMRAGSHDAKLAYLGGHNFEPVVSKLGLGSVTEVVYDFVFTPPRAQIEVQSSAFAEFGPHLLPRCLLLIYVEGLMSRLQFHCWSLIA